MSNGRKRSYSVSVEQVWTRDRGVCWLCGTAVAPMRDFDCWKPGDRRSSPDYMLQPTRDHVEPLRSGGSNGAHNLRLAHRVCNSYRGRLPGAGLASVVYGLSIGAPMNHTLAMLAAEHGTVAW